MKICPKCNKEFTDDNSFCGNCGVPLEIKPVYCTKCGHIIEAGQTFCGECGAKVSTDISTKLKENASHIKSVVSDKAKEILSDENIDKVKDKTREILSDESIGKLRGSVTNLKSASEGLADKNNSKLSIKYVAIILILAVLLIIFFIKGEGPEDVAEKYIEIATTAVNTGEAKSSDTKWIQDNFEGLEAIQLATMELQQTSGMSAEAKRRGGKLKMNYKIVEVKENDNFATVTVTINAELNGVVNNKEKSSAKEQTMKIKLVKNNGKWKITGVQK